MKKIVNPIILSSLFVLAASSGYSADGSRYRINGLGSPETPVSFLNPNSWNQIDSSGWVDSDIPKDESGNRTQLPWDAYSNVRLKMDNANVYLDDSVSVYELRGIYLSTFTLKGVGTVLTIQSGELHTDGNSNNVSTINFEEGTGLNLLNGSVNVWRINAYGTATNKVTFNTSGFTMREYGVYNLTHVNWTNTSSTWNVNRGSTTVFDNFTRINATTSLGTFNMSDYNSSENYTTSVTIKDNSSFAVNNGNWNSARKEGQVAKFEMTGENSVFTMADSLQMQSDGHAYTGGKSTLEISGKNNTFSVVGDFNVMGHSNHGGNNSGGEMGIIIGGEGNKLTSVKRIHIGKNDGNSTFTGGKYYFHASGTSATNKNDIRVANINIGLGNDLGEGCTVETEMFFDGNVMLSGYYVDGGTRVGAGLTVGSNSSTYNGTLMNGGTATMRVSGSGNDMYLSSLNVLNGSNIANGAKGVVNWGGSNNKIETTGDVNILSANEQRGGTVTMTIGGTNNTYIFGNNFRVASANMLGGTADVILTGTGNTMVVKGQLYIGNADNNAAVADVVRGTFTMDSGTSLTAKELRIGAGTSTQDRNAYGVLTIKGTAHVTVTDTMNLHSSAASSYGDELGGYLVFQASSDAEFGYLEAGRLNLNDGYIVVDFSQISGAIDDGYGGYRYWTILDTGTANISADDVHAILREGDDEDAFFVAVAGSEVRIYYRSTVPEPSTYAAIFGAVALAFAAYRRRNRK